MSLDHVLEIRDLWAGYREMPPLIKGASYAVPEGEVIGIVGDNGAGKSTLLHATIGLLKPSSGRVVLDGEDVAGLPPHRIIARGMSYLPQVRSTFMKLTVEDNLALATFAMGSRHSAREAVRDSIALIPPIRDWLSVKVGELSGGQRQLVGLGRCLVTNPKVLLLDEPLASLDPAARDQLLDTILRLNEAGVAIVIVEQDVRLVREISSALYEMSLGQTHC